MTLAGWTFPNNPDDALVDVAVPQNAGAQIVAIGTAAPGFTFVGHTTFSAHATDWDAGAGAKWWQIEVNTTGHQNLWISSRQTSSGTGPRNFTLQYRIGVAGAWTALATVPPITTANNWNQGVLTAVPLPVACENQPSLFFRWIMTNNTSVGGGTVAAGGVSRIDDIYVAANSADHFRTVGSGAWHDAGIWETSPTGAAPWSATPYTPSHVSASITIRNGHTATISQYASMDQTTVEQGGTLVLAGGPPRIADGAGVDLDVQGTLEDALNGAAPGSTQWDAGARWRLGTSGTYIKTGSSNATDWQDNYFGGIASMAETATWILRRNSGLIPSATAVGMIYPNLVIENLHTLAFAVTFAGTTGFPTILGDLDVGGAGTNSSTLTYSNTNATPMSVLGDMSVRAGSTLSITGTGLSVEGDILCHGGIGHGAANTRRITLAGGQQQTISGSGGFTAFNLTVAKAAGDVALQMPLTVNNNLQLTSGRILNDGGAPALTLNTTATATGGSNASFVTGRMRKLGNAAFTFPVGKGALMRPIGMSAVPAPSALGPSTETFTRGAGDCAAGCDAHNYTTDFGTWTVTATGANGPAGNRWYISYSESGPLNSCPPSPGTNPTLHIGPLAGGICPTVDCGAFYDDGPDNITDLRAESPVMDFSNTTITSFGYAARRGNTVDADDVASLWAYDGSIWVHVFDFTNNNCFSVGGGPPPALANALNNNPNARIGIRWRNNGNGVVNSKSFAIDNIALGRSLSIESLVAEYFDQDPEPPYNDLVNPPLDHISSCEFWHLDREVGTHARQVTLSWDVNSCGVTFLPDLRVAHFDTLAPTPSWFDRGNTGTTGNIAAGTVTSGPNDRFGPFTLASISGQNPLPITLLSFTGRVSGQDGLLHWTTASEQNNAWFDVLSRSAEHVEDPGFTTIGRVTGMGDSWSPVDYHFVDDRPNKRGIHFYQLRQVDHDGTTSHSPIIALNYDMQGLSDPRVWPNPFQHDALVQLDVPFSGMLHVRALNTLGRSVAHATFGVDKGTFTFTLGDLLPAEAGVYLLQLDIGDHRAAVRVVRH
ncbi:MAG: hypothetical protein KIT10_12125 [Flavobacteriales bacterium]|nr:hypothetical protein [Flavobacteriales bacterium]